MQMMMRQKTTSRNAAAKRESMRAGANVIGTSEWKPRGLCRVLAWAGGVSLMKRLRNTPDRICSPGEQMQSARDHAVARSAVRVERRWLVGCQGEGQLVTTLELVYEDKPVIA